MSDLLENIVNIVNGSSFRKLLMKSSSVKSTKCEHVFDAFDPYNLSPSSLRAIILTKVLSYRMMKCTIHLFLFWLTSHGCTRASELERRKYHVSLLPSPLLLVLSVIVGQNRFGVSSDNFEF